MKQGQFLGGIFLGVHPLSHGRLVLREIRPTPSRRHSTALADRPRCAFYLTDSKLDMVELARRECLIPRNPTGDDNPVNPDTESRLRHPARFSPDAKGR
jgi:hypothetical protein